MNDLLQLPVVATWPLSCVFPITMVYFTTCSDIICQQCLFLLYPPVLYKTRILISLDLNFNTNISFPFIHGQLGLQVFCFERFFSQVFLGTSLIPALITFFFFWFLFLSHPCRQEQVGVHENWYCLHYATPSRSLSYRLNEVTGNCESNYNGLTAACKCLYCCYLKMSISLPLALSLSLSLCLSLFLSLSLSISLSVSLFLTL